MVDSKAFYDDFAEHQVDAGITPRHRAIEIALRRAGWRRGQRILEIGCGVGTLSELIARGLGPRGTLLAVDLSPRSIDLARRRLAAFSQVELLAADVLVADLGGPFDVIVLPDVVEHIPLEHHPQLFERIAASLAHDGFVLLNYPNPLYLEWCQQHRPDLLQAVDQPIHADRLLADAYAHGLYLDRLETYSVWIRQGDYVLAVLRPRRPDEAFTEMPPNRRLRLGSLAARLRALIAR